MISFGSVLDEGKLKEFDGSQLSRRRGSSSFIAMKPWADTHHPEGRNLFFSEEINIQEEKLTGL